MIGVLQLAWAYRKYVGAVLGLVAIYVLYAMWHHHVFTLGEVKERAVWVAKWAARDKAEQATVAAELERQRKQAEQIAKVNADVEAKLNDREREVAGLRRDLDLARRLLAAAAGSSGPGGAMPASQDQSPASAPGAPGETEGSGSLAGKLADALGECRRTADDWDALQAELAPQLGPVEVSH